MLLPQNQYVNPRMEELFFKGAEAMEKAGKPEKAIALHLRVGHYPDAEMVGERAKQAGKLTEQQIIEIWKRVLGQTGEAERIGSGLSQTSSYLGTPQIRPEGEELAYLLRGARYAREHKLPDEAIVLYDRAGQPWESGRVATEAERHEEAIGYFERAHLPTQAARAAIQAGRPPEDIVDIYARNRLPLHALEAARANGLHHKVIGLLTEQAASAATRARITRGY